MLAQKQWYRYANNPRVTQLCRPQLTQLLSSMDLCVLNLAVSILSLQVQSVLSTDKPVYFSLIVSYGEYGYNSSGG